MPHVLITDPRHDRFEGLGLLAVAWVEHFCVHGPGDVSERPLDPALPEALPMSDEICEFIADCYALDENGKRLYADAFISRPKGWAKSEVAGFIALFEAFGPCRVARDAFGLPRRAQAGDSFVVGSFRYDYDPGEFMGEPIRDPIVRCMATEEEQAGNTFDVVYVNLGGNGKGSLRLVSAYNVRGSDVGLRKIKLAGSGEIIPSTASSSSKDGGKETFVVFDESHLYITPELHRMYDTVTRNLGKRVAAEPWSLETSTMYGPGEGSVAEQTHRHARMISEKKSAATSTLFDHRQAPADLDVADPESLRAGILEAYGDAAEYTDIDRKVADFSDPRKRIEALRRYTLNQPTGSSNAWMTTPEWERIGPKDGEVLALQPKDKITLGFDGSQKRAPGSVLADASALVACRVSDGLIVPLLIDEQPEGPAGEGWQVDFEGFLDAVDNAFETYDVVGFFADPPLWQETITNWENLYGDRLPIKAAKTAIAWWTNRDVVMGRAIDAFEGAVKDQDIRQAGDPTLTRHVLNARRKPRGMNMRIVKENPSSNNKIDGAIAAVLAHAARAAYVALGEQPTKKRRTTRIVAANRR